MKCTPIRYTPMRCTSVRRFFRGCTAGSCLQGCGLSGSAALPASVIECHDRFSLSHSNHGKLRESSITSHVAVDLEASRSFALRSGKLSDYVYIHAHPRTPL
jgi:hypothetical protein